jgi:hypothetical protein
MLVSQRLDRVRRFRRLRESGLAALTADGCSHTHCSVAKPGYDDGAQPSAIIPRVVKLATRHGADWAADGCGDAPPVYSNGFWADTHSDSEVRAK